MSESKLYTFNKKFFEKIVNPRARAFIFWREHKNLIQVKQIWPSRSIHDFLEKPSY